MKRRDFFAAAVAAAAAIATGRLPWQAQRPEHHELARRLFGREGPGLLKNVSVGYRVRRWPFTHGSIEFTQIDLDDGGGYLIPDDVAELVVEGLKKRGAR